MRFIPLLLVLPVVGACSLNPPAPGNADVTGRVLQSSGQPLANSSVVIDCGVGGSMKTVPTDSAGRYGANLSAPAGQVRCVFGVPDLSAPRIRVDTAIGFAPYGQLHPLQFIDLREAPAP